MNQKLPKTTSMEIEGKIREKKEKVILNSFGLNNVGALLANLQSNPFSINLNALEKIVPAGPPDPKTKGYLKSSLPQYDGFVLDETRKLKIQPLTFLIGDLTYTTADLWIKDIGGAPLVFERQAPSAVHWTGSTLPTYEITLYRGSNANNDLPVDNHRFVFINDAKAGFNRFIHEWELYRRTTGDFAALNKVYDDDKTDPYFPLWHDHGSVSDREAMPNAWYVGRVRVVGDRFVKQALIWARLAHRAQVALRDGWSVYARYWDKKADGVTVYLDLHEKLAKMKNFDFKGLEEKVDAFRLNFKPKLKENKKEANVTQSDLIDGNYVSLGKHVLGLFELFVSKDDFDKMEGVNQDRRPPPNQRNILRVLLWFVEKFVADKSVSSVNVDNLDEEFLESLARKMETDLNETAAKTFRNFSRLVKTARNRTNILDPIQKFPMTVDVARIKPEFKVVKIRKRELKPPGRLPIFDDLIDFFAGRTSLQDAGTITHVTKAKISTASIYKKRNPDQNAVMGLSATTVAESLWKRSQEDFTRTAEWLHRSAFSYGGLGNKSTPNTSQVPGNLVFGTYEANTFMLRYESSIKNLSMLEEKESDFANSVVTTHLSYEDNWWPSDIADSQSWLAPHLHYEWEFNCTRVKLPSAQHNISLFSRKIPTLFAVFFDELVEDMLYNKEIEQLNEKAACAGSVKNIARKKAKAPGKIGSSVSIQVGGLEMPPSIRTVDEELIKSNVVAVKKKGNGKVVGRVVNKKNTQAEKKDGRSASPIKKHRK